jgi:RpiB/LacA/LacB family sugar-phosphate isomerase
LQASVNAAEGGERTGGGGKGDTDCLGHGKGGGGIAGIMLPKHREFDAAAMLASEGEGEGGVAPLKRKVGRAGVTPLPVAEAVAKKQCDLGVIICGTGIGVSIVANKVPGVRASLCHDVFSAKATRVHNDSNVLCMGARVIGEGLMLEIVDAYLSASFEGGRHQARLDKIAAIEQKYSK